MLNRRKGPAMHGPRAQADKLAYQREIRRILDAQPELTLLEETVEDLLVDNAADSPLAVSQPAWRIAGVRTAAGREYRARAVVLCTGTFMHGLLHFGEATTPGGRMGEPTSAGVSRSLARLGFELQRFKTGTPPRIDGRTIDYGHDRTPAGRRPAHAVLLPHRPDRRASRFPAGSSTPRRTFTS